MQKPSLNTSAPEIFLKLVHRPDWLQELTGSLPHFTLASISTQATTKDTPRNSIKFEPKKILLISNTIGTSSSVIQACITNNPRCLDLGGAAVLMYRLFTDVRFITRLKEEYLTSNLNDIYDQRINGILE